jgi:hypothetical protein
LERQVVALLGRPLVAPAQTVKSAVQSILNQD